MKKTVFTEYQRMAFASEAHFKSVPEAVRVKRIQGSTEEKPLEKQAQDQKLLPTVIHKK